MSETQEKPVYETPYGVETDLTRKTIVVTEHETGDEFEFRIPSIQDEVTIGLCMRRLRRKADPLDDGAGALDVDTMTWLRSMALFESLLVSSSADWPYSKNDSGKRVVDTSKFPPEKTSTALFVALSVNGEVDRFRYSRTADRGTPSEQAVAS